MSRYDDKRICAALAHPSATLHSTLLLCAIGEGESRCGDAPDLPGNWGAIQKRALTLAEKVVLSQGKFPTPTAPDEQLHGDTSPTAGAYEVWFYKFTRALDHGPDDVTAAKRLVYELEKVRGILDWRTLEVPDLAARMYDARYYQGFTTDRDQAIATYAAMLQRGYAAFGEGVFDQEDEETGTKWSWAVPDSESFLFQRRPGEALRDRIVRCCDEAAALGRMSESVHQLRYSTFVRCAVDASDGLDRVRTSCAIVQRAVDDHCGRAATKQWPSLVGGGMFGGWLGDLSYQHPAWVPNKPGNIPREGDVFYVAANITSNNNHVGRFVRELGPGHWQTFEGGGGAGTETGMTDRTMGPGFAGAHQLIGWWDADKMGYL